MQLARWLFFSLLALVTGLFLLQKYIRGPVVPALQAQRGPVVQKVAASGQIVPNTRVKIISQVIGNVTEVMVQEGDEVEAGQLLVQVSNAEATALVEQAQAAHDMAQARADKIQGVTTRVTREALRLAELKRRQARLDVRREEELVRTKASTREVLEQARTALQLAENQYQEALTQAKAAAPPGSDMRLALAAVEQSHGVLAAAEARLDQYRITAPLAARVIERSIEPGDGVQPGARLLVLASLDAPRAVVQVDEKYLSLLREGLPARVTAEAFPGRTFEAKVERLAPAVDPERGSIEVELVIQDAPPFLRYDMSASVEIITNSAEGALLLPIAAVHAASSDQPYVYAVSEGRVEKRPVKLGLRGDSVVEITAGLNVHDIVLIPRENLSDGAAVRPEVKRWPGAV